MIDDHCEHCDIFIIMADSQAIKKNNPEFSVVNEKN